VALKKEIILEILEKAENAENAISNKHATNKRSSYEELLICLGLTLRDRL